MLFTTQRIATRARDDLQVSLRHGVPGLQAQHLLEVPLRLIQLWLVGVYFFSGLAKLRASGIEWAGSDNLTHWLRLATQNDLVAVHRVIGSWLADRPVVAGAIGIGTMAFELGCVVALASRRARPWFAVLAISFHAGIYLAMNITVNSWPLLLVFFDWERILARGRPLPAEPP